MTKEEFEKKLQESFGINSYDELDFKTLTKIVVKAIGGQGSYDPMQEECVEMLEYILEADSKLPPSRFFDNRKCSQQDTYGNSVLVALKGKTKGTPLMYVNLAEVVELFIKYNPDALYIENIESESFVGEIFRDLGWEWSHLMSYNRRFTFEDIENEYAVCFMAMTKILEHNPIRAWKAITSNRYLTYDQFGNTGCCLYAMEKLTELLYEDGKLKSLDQSDKEVLDSCIKNADHIYDINKKIYDINKENDRSK